MEPDKTFQPGLASSKQLAINQAPERGQLPGAEIPTKMVTATVTLGHLPGKRWKPGEISHHWPFAPTTRGLGKTANLKNQAMGIGLGMAMAASHFNALPYLSYRMMTDPTTQRLFTIKSILLILVLRILARS